MFVLSSVFQLFHPHPCSRSTSTSFLLLRFDLNYLSPFSCLLACAATVMCKMSESPELQLQSFSAGGVSGDGDEIKVDETNAETRNKSVQERDGDGDGDGGSFCPFFRRVPLNEVCTTTFIHFMTRTNVN